MGGEDRRGEGVGRVYLCGKLVTIMKDVRVKAGAGCRFAAAPECVKTRGDVAPGYGEAQVTVCRNMRRSTVPGDGGLVPVGEPVTVVEGTARPFFMFRHGDGRRTLLLKSGNILSRIDPEAEGTAAVEVAVLPSEPQCAVASGNTIVVMTDDGAFRIIRDEEGDGWVIAGMMPTLPAISIVAAETATFTSTVAARTLTGGYTRWSGSLTAADASAITADLLNAYNEIHTKATNAGYYIQPVMAAYVLRDKEGTVIYRSAPVMVSAPGGFQCRDAMAVAVGVSSGAFAAMDGHTVSVTGFKPAIVAPELMSSPWGDIIASAEIRVTTQLHPVDFNARASYRMESDSATQGILRMYMPGTANAMIPATARLRETVAAVAGRVWSMGRTAAVFTRPLTGGIAEEAGTRVWLPCMSRQSAAAERKETDSGIAAKADDGGDTMLRRMNVPHSFTARTATVTGDMTVWGDITPHRFKGHAAGEWASSIGTGRWRACVKTTFAASGETAVWHGEGETNAPTALSPLLSYPDPAATGMTIRVCYDDGTVMSRSVSLTPTADNTAAYYLDETLAPIAIDTPEEIYVIPAETEKTDHRGGMAATAKAAAPMAIEAATEVSQGCIRAITPAVRSTSAWDFARTHLYAFTTAGIYAVAVSGKRTAMAATVIDSRGVENAGQVAAAADCVYAVADGCLTAVQGSRTAVIDTRRRFKSAGWCGATGELWCVTEDDRVLAMNTAAGECHYRDTEVPAAMMADGGRLFVTTGGRTVDASVEVPQESVEVEWQARVNTGGDGVPLHRRSSATRRISSVRWDMASKEADVTVSVRGDGGAGSGNSYPILVMGLKGSINSPISARVIAPGRPFVTVAVAGRVSGDTVVRGVEWG